MTPQQLKTLIDSQPEGSPIRVAYAAGDDTGTTRLFNDKTGGLTRLAPMRLSAFNQFLMGRAMLHKITAGQQSTVDQIASICCGVVLLLQGASDREFDPNDPETIGLVDALVAAGIATSADKNALISACTVPASLAEIECGRAVSVDEIARTRGV